MSCSARACGWAALTLALSPVPLHAASAAIAQPASAAAAAEPSSFASGLATSLPLRRDSDVAWDGSGSSGFAIVALAILLALVSGWAFWRRVWTPGGLRGDGGLRVAQSTRLTARASVHVVQWDDRQWLVGCTDNAVTVLGERPRASGASGAGHPGSKADQ